MASPTAPLFWQTRPFARDSELRLSRKKHLNPQLAPLHVGTVPNTCHRGPIRAPAGRPRLLSPWTSRHAPSRNEDHGRHSERTGGKEKGDGGDSSHGCCTLTPCENPSESEKANKLVEAAFHATGLRAAAEFLRSSRAAFIGSVAAFATALLLPRLFQGSAACEAASQALTGVVYLLAGLPGFMDVCHDVASLTINTHVLTMLSVACLVPMGHALEGALLLLLFNLSHELEDTLTATAQGDMRALLNSVPSTAAVVQLGADGEPDLSTETEVAAEDVVVGQLVAVRAGQEVPLDGEVLRGEAMLSAEYISGESIPQYCRPGMAVPAGAVNNDGLLIIRVTATMENSTPARMAALARQAQQHFTKERPKQANKPRVQTLVESVLASYSKVVLAGTAAVAFLLPLLAGVPLVGTPSSPGSLYRAAGFLTTAAPCAILMAPLVYVSAIAAAAQRGILLKGASVIDSLAGCRAVALDKTGTLTTGQLTCTAIVRLFSSEKHKETGDENANDLSPTDLAALGAALALSRGSVHPVSSAVAEALGGTGSKSIPPVQLNNHSSLPGKGLRGVCNIDGGEACEVLFGSAPFIGEELLAAGQLEAAEAVAASGAAAAGEVMSFLALVPQGRQQQGEGGVFFVYGFHFNDRAHPTSRAALAALRHVLKPGLQVAMLSGDNKASAYAMAKQLGMTPDEVRAELRPEDKLGLVAALRKDHGGSVLMVGDGINDAPALAAADVGLAVAATPSTAAAAVADGVVLSGSGAGVSALPFLLSLSAFTRMIVVQNFTLAGIAILVTALPAVAGLLPLWVGVAIHEGSTVLVALNSLRPLMHRGPRVESAPPVPAKASESPAGSNGPRNCLDTFRQLTPAGTTQVPVLLPAKQRAILQ